MSTSLYWSIIPKEPKDYCIDSIKYEIAKRIWGTDGSCGEGYHKIGKELVPFLEGIIAGNGSGDMSVDAQKLINAITEHEEVQICLKS